MSFENNNNNNVIIEKKDDAGENGRHGTGKLL